MTETEPGEIFQERALELDARALPIVILDAEQRVAATFRAAPQTCKA